MSMTIAVFQLDVTRWDSEREFSKVEIAEIVQGIMSYCKEKGLTAVVEPIDQAVVSGRARVEVEGSITFFEGNEVSRTKTIVH